MNTSPSSSARRALGARLRDLRKGAGLTARALAELTGQHYTRVSKIENGVQLPTVHDLRAWCRACTAGDQIDDLIATTLTIESAYVDFRRQSRGSIKRVLGAHTVQRYRNTTHFRIYEHNVIPGLFQTAEYASAMLDFWIDFLGLSDDAHDAAVTRAERQNVLREPGKRFAAIIEEQALRTWFGTAETQAGQLGRLLELMPLPNVSLGIIPLMVERKAVGSAGFWIFDDVLVALETPSAGIEVTQPGEIRQYIRMFDVLRTSAVYGREARNLIVSALNEL